MASTRLSDVHRMLEKGEEQFTGPYFCYVANYDSEHPPPRHFSYRGCSYLKGNKLVCGKSIEIQNDPCGHNPSRLGNHSFMFRFDIYLFDANFGGLPLRACIFDSARNLLDIGPNEFHVMEESQQIETLHAATVANPLVNVWLRTYSDGRCVVQKLQKVILLDSPPGTPASKYYTPPLSARSSKVTGVGTSSSTSRVYSSAAQYRGKVKLDDPQAQPNLAHTMELLASLSTRDNDIDRE